MADYEEAMKIKYIFDPDDFQGRGQRVIRASVSASASPFSKANRTYMVSYNPACPEKVFLTAMTDGLMLGFSGVSALCEYLNNDAEGWRPATQEELQEGVRAIGNRFPT